MGKFRGLDVEDGWIRRELAELKRMIMESSAGRRLEAAVIERGGLLIRGGGSVTITDSGKVQVFSAGSIATMEQGRFGMVTIDGSGNLGYPSFVTTVDGFLADAGPGKGYMVCRVDAATGKAVISSSTGAVMLSYTNTSAAANTRILSDGTIQMVTSSLRYKQDVLDADIDPDEMLAVRVRTWRDKAEVEADPDTTQRYTGVIAEELHKLPTMRQFIDYNEEDQPNAVSYDRLALGLLKVVQRQEERLRVLEQQGK